ncbi:unnamed protein product, partial [Ectocarpus sp. 6 AP-2014]
LELSIDFCHIFDLIKVGKFRTRFLCCVFAGCNWGIIGESGPFESRTRRLEHARFPFFPVNIPEEAERWHPAETDFQSSITPHASFCKRQKMVVLVNISSRAFLGRV